VRPLSCTRLSIGNVLEFVCWKWKPYPWVVFRKSRLVWVLFYIWEICCLYRVLTCVIPNCFRFAKICLCQVSLLSRCSPRYFRSSSWGSCTLFIWTERHVSLGVVNVTWINLDSFAFIIHLLKQSWIASRPVCSFCEAMADHCPWLLLQYCQQKLLW
jgi:hypothetical protein